MGRELEDEWFVFCRRISNFIRHMHSAFVTTLAVLDAILLGNTCMQDLDLHLVMNSRFLLIGPEL